MEDCLIRHAGEVEKQATGVEINLSRFTSEANRTRCAGNGCDADSVVGDVQFVDPVAGDFQIKDGSPALKLGFKNLAMDPFGVRKASLKAKARTPEIPPPQQMDGSVTLPGRNAAFENRSSPGEGKIACAPPFSSCIVPSARQT